MRRDLDGRAIFQSTAPHRATSRSAHVDYALRYVLARIIKPGAGIGARLDAVEETLVALARRWRPAVPLRPAREVRFSEDSVRQLLRWVEEGEPYDPGAIGRLGVYASGALTDPTVPHGWVRILLVD